MFLLRFPLSVRPRKVSRMFDGITCQLHNLLGNCSGTELVDTITGDKLIITRNDPFFCALHRKQGTTLWEDREYHVVNSVMYVIIDDTHVYRTEEMTSFNYETAAVSSMQLYHLYAAAQGYMWLPRGIVGLELLDIVKLRQHIKNWRRL